MNLLYSPTGFAALLILVGIVLLPIALVHLRKKRDGRAWANKSLRRSMITIRGLESLIVQTDLRDIHHTWEIHSYVTDALEDELIFCHGESKKSPTSMEDLPSFLRDCGYEYLGDSSFGWILDVCSLLLSFGTDPAFRGNEEIQTKATTQFIEDFGLLLRLCPGEILDAEKRWS